MQKCSDLYQSCLKRIRPLSLLKHEFFENNYLLGNFYNLQTLLHTSDYDKKENAQEATPQKLRNEKVARIINRSNSMQRYTHTKKKRGGTEIEELEIRLLEREMTHFEDNKIQNFENFRASRSSQQELQLF